MRQFLKKKGKNTEVSVVGVGLQYINNYCRWNELKITNEPILVDLIVNCYLRVEFYVVFIICT